MWLGANAPGRFTGLVLANPAANFPPPDLWRGRADAVRTSGIAPLVEATLERWFTKAFRQASSKRLNEIGQMLLSASTEGYASCCGVLAEADLLPQLGR